MGYTFNHINSAFEVGYSVGVYQHWVEPEKLSLLPPSRNAITLSDPLET